MNWKNTVSSFIYKKTVMITNSMTGKQNERTKLKYNANRNETCKEAKS
jgi:hypothetical protein